MGVIYSLCCGRKAVAGARADLYKLEEEQPKAYSWDAREKPDPKNFVFDGIEQQTVGKLPGEINGQQFVIQNCKMSNLYLFDHSASVTIDDCLDCAVFVGPCKGSVFIRDCKNCRFMIACQQFRTRDCRNLDVFLHCSTQPIIEESKQIRFACFQLHYSHLADQLKNSKLSVFNNSWSNIHDFTPLHGNYSYLPENSNPADYISFEEKDCLSPPLVNCAPEASIVPLTHGSRPTANKDVSFVLCFCDETGPSCLRTRCLDLIKEVQKENIDLKLINTKEIAANAQDIERILGTKKYQNIAEKGPVIGMEWCGENVSALCSQHASKAGWLDKMHIPEPGQMVNQMRRFYSFTQMELGV